MTVEDSLLEGLVGSAEWQSDWPDVVRRTHAPATTSVSRRRAPYRRLVLPIAAAIAIMVPLAAFGDSNDWWFFHSSGAPIAAGAPAVAATGTWDGHAWKIVAYPSTTDGLCVSLTPIEPGLERAAGLSCGPFAGVQRTNATKDSPDMSITYLMSSGTGSFPAYIVGPVAHSAESVSVEFGDGSRIHLPTTPANSKFGDIRFYATSVPARSVGQPTRLTGFDRGGSVVACLVPGTAVNGVSLLSDCQ